MTNIYNKVIGVDLTELCKKGQERTEIYFEEPDELLKYIETKDPHLAEKISTKQIKPAFDCDIEIDDMDINDTKALDNMQKTYISFYTKEIQNKFKNKEIRIGYRPYRKVQTNKGEKVKISLRFYVQGVRISPNILKKMYEKEDFLNMFPMYDLSIYGSNKGLYLPYTTKHPCRDKTIGEQKQLLPMNYNNNLFDYCCSYIDETYENWDDYFQDAKITYKEIIVDDGEDEEKDANNLFKKLEEYITHLSVNRATEYNTWINMMFCICNICKKHKLSKRQRDNLLHLFSSLSKEKYNEDEIDKWIYKNADNIRENGYGWNYLKYECLQIDDVDYFDKKLGKTYKYVKEQFEKEVAKFMNPVGFMRIVKDDLNRDDSNPFQLLDKSKLTTAYQNLYYWEEDEKKGWVEKKFINKWLDDSKMLQYEKMIFKPYHLPEGGKHKYYNLYSGVRAEKITPLENVDYTIIEPILNHIKRIMLCNNQQYYNWFIQYLAQMIQKPDMKTDTCVIFHGKQGCGKNIFIDFFANGILGKDLSFSTANPTKTIFSQFNACIINKILVVCNEIGGEMYGLMDKIKDLITAPSLDTEKKFADRISVDNYINVIMTTNNTNPLNIPLDDRRFVWFECNNAEIGNTEYFEKLLELMSKEEIVYTFYHYLKHHIKIEITNFQITRPITEAYKKIQNLNIPNHIRFIQEYIKENDVKFKKVNKEEVNVIKRKDFYMKYRIWAENNKYTAMKQSAFYHHLESDENGIELYTQRGFEVYKINKKIVDEYLINVGFNLKIQGIKELEFNWDDTYNYEDDDEE